ncbi:Phosphomethylpyrimidine synthase [Dissostichus eleginoides]|uniref:Phosphomethylpyrimidine synthase n=1 Tax=Dissostichus eleginoides TaxID=100907 RepID=A0AAD9CN65_DISEL|nr:Phosphomethylpyrimidine synthase [Dissostichus eleginoides]
MTAEAALQNLKKTTDDEQESQDDTKGMRMASCDDEILSWLYWVSLKIKADIRESPRHDVMGGIDQHHAEEVVPESLYLLLRLLCTDDDDQENMDKQTVNTKLLSIAQDIVFLASGGQRPTPKHIGIGVAVHQATRSKGLVQLLHAAGHSISYESVLRTDTAIANEAVKQYFDNGRVFIPQNVVNAKLPGYIMYANYNIDINEETLDGKGTFHASQTAAFRRSEPQEQIPKVKLISRRAKSLSIPPGMFELKDAKMES